MLKTRVRRSFNRAAETYDAAAATQRRVLRELLSHVGNDALTPARSPARSPIILDAGCGTGAGLPLLRSRWPRATVLALDFAERMLPAAATDQLPLCGDLGRLPLAAASVDIYWSSLSWQWCALPQVLAEARRVLKPGGALAVSTLASRSFHELRDAFTGIDAHAHTLDFLSVETVASCVAAAGFSALQLTREAIIEWHPDLKTLLRQVKQAGAHEISGARRRGLLGKHAFASAEQRYAAKYGISPATATGDNIATAGATALPLTYDVLYLIARA